MYQLVCSFMGAHNITTIHWEARKVFTCRSYTSLSTFLRFLPNIKVYTFVIYESYQTPHFYVRLNWEHFLIISLPRSIAMQFLSFVVAVKYYWLQKSYWNATALFNMSQYHFNCQPINVRGKLFYLFSKYPFQYNGIYYDF